jgi:uncharacterized phage protein gp47/JayE
MTYTPRSDSDILKTLTDYLTLYSSITDFNDGGVVLTMLEAVAQELGEQNFQLSQILKAFSIFSAKGPDLDRRVADFGIYRQPARPAITKVRFYDTTVVVGKVAAEAAAGSTTLRVFDSSIFPTTGYPYVLRINENTPVMQNVTVSNNNLATSTLTVNALTYIASVGSTVNLVSGQSSRVINSGVQVQIPSTVVTEAKTYVTTEQAYISLGNTFSNEVVCKSTGSGSALNGPAGAIKSFLATPPFAGASVSNTSVISGGRDIESDEELQRRAVEQIFGISAATKKALKAAAKNAEDPVTGKRVKSASVVEDFSRDEVIVYVDDGTGNVLDFSAMPVGSLGVVAAGALTVPLSAGIDSFPSSGYALILDGANSELINYTTKTATAVIASSGLSYSHAATTTVYSVELISSSTELSQTLFRLSSIAITRDSEIIFAKTPSGTWRQLVRDVEYTLNRGTGEFVLFSALPTGSSIVSSYSYNTGLAAELVKVLEGFREDPVNYPGVKAAGVRISVENPIIRRVAVICLVTAKSGYDELSLRVSVQAAIERYFASLEVGDDVIYSRLLAVANAVDGVNSAKIQEPPDDVSLLEKEQSSCFAASGTSLVIVS